MAVRPLSERYAEDENGCWIWTGARCGPKRKQYGYMRWAGRQQVAHRTYYEEYVGPIPEGLQLHHECNQSLCVNPAHLRPVTGAENIQERPDLRLCPESVREIRASNLPSRALADRFGVSRATIDNVKRRYTWGTVPDAA